LTALRIQSDRQKIRPQGRDPFLPIPILAVVVRRSLGTKVLPSRSGMGRSPLDSTPRCQIGQSGTGGYDVLQQDPFRFTESEMANPKLMLMQ